MRSPLMLFQTYKRTLPEYDEFWKNFGKYIKVGAVEEQGDVQKDLAKLCRFYSTKSGMNKQPFQNT